MSHPRLQHHALATIRQATHRGYPKVEAMLETMDAEQLQELIRLVTDANDEGKRSVRGKARRLGLGHLIR
jgi:hypothetical protein